MTTKKSSNQKSKVISNKDTLYKELISHCDKLPIARYLKNEVKNTLQYFHEYKLGNIKKNLIEFSDYLLLLNQENCKKIENLKIGNETRKNLNNSISYFYNYDGITDEKLADIQGIIESNSYETISVMQSLKGYLILTIDEFCNASPTRIDIIRYNLNKQKRK